MTVIKKVLEIPCTCESSPFFLWQSLDKLFFLIVIYINAYPNNEKAHVPPSCAVCLDFLGLPVASVVSCDFLFRPFIFRICSALRFWCCMWILPSWEPNASWDMFFLFFIWRQQAFTINLLFSKCIQKWHMQYLPIRHCSNTLTKTVFLNSFTSNLFYLLLTMYSNHCCMLFHVYLFACLFAFQKVFWCGCTNIVLG